MCRQDPLVYFESRWQQSSGGGDSSGGAHSAVVAAPLSTGLVPADGDDAVLGIGGDGAGGVDGDGDGDDGYTSTGAASASSLTDRDHSAHHRVSRTSAVSDASVPMCGACHNMPISLCRENHHVISNCA